MSNKYIPTTWVGSKTVATANVMNNMEKGISDAHDRLDGVDEQFNTIEKKSYISPEECGAVGDGITDDTQALQTAINVAQLNRLRLISGGRKDGGKKYLITSTLFVNDLFIDIDFGSSAIITNKAIKMFEFKNSTRDFQGVIKNIKIDMNNIALIGFNITQTRSRIFKDIVFNNVTGTCVKINSQGGGNEFNNIFAFGGNSKDSVIFDVATSDCHFTDIYGVDIHTGVINNGSNFYTRVHTWMDTKSLIPGSCLFRQKGGRLYTNQCYSDTHHKAIIIEDSTAIFLEEFYTFHNGMVLNQETYTNLLGGHVYQFFITDLSKESTILSKIFISNSSFNGLPWGTSGNGFLDMYNGETTINKYFRLPSNNVLTGVNDFGGRAIQRSISTRSANVTETMVNEVSTINDIVTINFRGVMPVTISASTETVIGQIDGALTPLNVVESVGFYSVNGALRADGQVLIYIQPTTRNVCVKAVGNDLVANNARQIKFSVSYINAKTV